jgi:Skp family chaperone for outer membrane proteins
MVYSPVDARISRQSPSTSSSSFRHKKAPSVQPYIQQIAQAVKQKTDEQAAQLKEQAEHHYEKIKNNADRKIQAIQESVEEHAEKLKETTLNSIEALKEQGARETIALLNQEDEKILEERKRMRERALLERYDKPLSPELKDAIAEQFKNNISTIKNIVVEGEDSTFRRDFLDNFSAYENWFDTTLSTTQYKHDSSYQELMDRKNRLDTLTNLQHKADNLLREAQQKTSMSDDDYKRHRLMILYDLNSAYQENHEPISDEQLQKLVALAIVGPVEDEIIIKRG